MSNTQNDIFYEQLRETLDELEVQSMIFDMDVDIETLTLAPKETYKEARWITNWKEKRDGSDFNTNFDIDRE